MLIPTLEEEGEEEVDQMPIVAPAPKILTLNIKTIQELDSDIKYSLPTASEGGIDLSALTQILAPQSSVCVSLFPVLSDNKHTHRTHDSSKRTTRSGNSKTFFKT